MNKRTHILTGALAAAAVLLLGVASVGTGFSAWKTQVGVRAALSMQDGRQLALQEAALTVYQPAVQAAEQTPEETPEAKAPEESAAAADNAQAPEKTAAPEPEPAAASRAEDARPAGEAGTEPGTAEEAADAQAELLALAAPETAEPTALEPEAAEEGRTEAAKPEPLESAEPQTNESAAPEQPEPETQAAAPKGTPVEVSRPQGLCAEYPEVTLQPGGWAEYQVVLVNEGTADAALPELEIPDLPEGLHCEPPELPESGLLRAGERLTLTWIVHCEGEGRPVAFSVTAHLTQLPIAPAPSAAYTIVPGSGREEETP